MTTPLPPQDAVERGLTTSKADDCVVIASGTHSTNLRWANNTLTTNGVTRSSDATVISIVGGAERRAASLSRTGVDEAALGELVEQGLAAAEASQPAEDAADLVTGRDAPDFAAPPGETSVAS